MQILWKQVITKHFHNTNKNSKTTAGLFAVQLQLLVWLHLGKGVGEKKETIWLLSSSVGGLHWCIRPVSTSTTSPFSFNLQGLLEDLECSKNGCGPQSPACRICLCGQLDWYQSHCRPALPPYCVPASGTAQLELKTRLQMHKFLTFCIFW